MKLLLCNVCEDIFRLRNSVNPRFCGCGETWGRYTDPFNAIYGGDATPLGFANGSLLDAIKNRPHRGRGMEFSAFVIPSLCDTFSKSKEKP